IANGVVIDARQPAFEPTDARGHAVSGDLGGQAMSVGGHGRFGCIYNISARLQPGRLALTPTLTPPCASGRGGRINQSQLPEQGTNVPALAWIVAEPAVRPEDDAVTVMVPAPVAWMMANARPW